MNALIKLIVLLFSLSFYLSSTFAQVDSLRVYFIGNSVTENLKPEAFESIVKAADKKITWGWNVIYGQALSYLWDHSGEGFIEPPFNGFENALTNYQWDAMTLQPYQRKIGNSDGDLASALKYLNLAKERSPDIQPYIYQRWPRLPEGVTPTAHAWDSLWLRSYEPENAARYDSRDFFEKLTDSVRSHQMDTKKCLMIPVGEVMYRLNQQMAEGNMPGYSNIWEVYRDDIHMKGIGSYIVAATFYATLYQSDPRGITVPGIYGFLNPDQRATIQQAIYETITDYHDSNKENWSGVDEITYVSVTEETKAQFTVIQSPQGLNIIFHEPFAQSVKRIQLYSITGQLLQTRLATDYCVLHQPYKGIHIISVQDLKGKAIFPTQKVFMD
jgi:hypothetical protein